MTLDESRNIRRELLRLESDYDKEITRRNTEIDRLKDIIATLEGQAKQATQLAPKRASKPKVDDSINDDQESILIDIIKFDGWVNDDNYLSNSKFDTVKAEYYLEDLESKGYLTRKFDTSKGGKSSTLTTKGKKFAIDKGVVS